MADIFDYGEDHLETDSANNDSGFVELSRLITMMAQAEIELARALEQVEKVKENVKDLKQRRIPDLMDELNCRTHETKSGLKVTIKQVVKASITDKTRAAAIAWFEEENLGRMVKNEFSLKLNKGEEEKAAALRGAIETLGLEYKNKKNVHHSTLSAFVKERDAAGETTPDELFNTFRYAEAKIG